MCQIEISLDTIYCIFNIDLRLIAWISFQLPPDGPVEYGLCVIWSNYAKLGLRIDKYFTSYL